MEYNQLKVAVASANARVKKINDERQVNKGKLATLQAQLTESIKKYNEENSTNLTLETLEAELSRVSQEKEAEVSMMNNVLALIDAGQYEEARVLLGVEPEVKVEQAVTPTGEVASAPTSVPTIEEPVASSSVSSSASSTSFHTTPMEVQEDDDVVTPPPVLSKPSVAEDDDVVAPPPTLSRPKVVEEDDEDDGVVAPPPVLNKPEPKADSVEEQVSSFSAILAGSDWSK